MRPFLTLHHPAKARDYYEQGHWRHETLYTLLARHAAERPDAFAARDGTRRLTWAQLKDWVDRIAAALCEAGVEAGDRISVWGDNRLEGVAIVLAGSRSGIACNPSLHRTYTSAEIVTLIDRLKSKLIYTVKGWGADGKAGEVAETIKAAPTLKAVWTPDAMPTPKSAPPPPVTDPDKVFYLAFTSGTTGNPKCVMHSDNTLMSNCRDLARIWGHGPQTRMLSLSPLSHHIAWVGVGQWLAAGAEYITDDPPAGRSRLDWIVETGATYVLGVPTHAMDILAEQQRRGLARLGEVEVFYMAGAAIPPVTAAAFVEQGIRPQNVYGMTENSSHQFTHPDDSTETIVNTCGRGGPAYEVKVFKAGNQDEEAPVGTEGQIGSRGAVLMLGYFDNQSATESSSHCLIENVTEQLPAVTGLAPLDRAGGVPWRGRSAWRHEGKLRQQWRSATGQPAAERRGAFSTSCARPRAGIASMRCERCGFRHSWSPSRSRASGVTVQRSRTRWSRCGKRPIACAASG